MQNEYTVGQLFSIKNIVVEVCTVGGAGQCLNCAGFNKKALCNKLPDCGNKFYFKKLNSFDLRKAKRENKVIKNID